jgi:multiple sugar transport system substrate-binding protein
MKHLLTLTGTGLIVAGFGDYFLRGSATQVSPTDHLTTTSKTASVENLLPDYQEFLSWLQLAATRTKQNSVNVSMEAEFTPFSIQRRSLDFLRYSNITDQYSLKPYALQLSDVSLMIGTQSPTYDVFAVDNQNLGVFKNAFISPLTLAQEYPDLTNPNLKLDEISRFAWDTVATYPPDLTQGPGGNTASEVPLLPLDMPLLVLFIRSDIYSKQGMAIPRTWDEYYEDVVALSKSRTTPFAAANMAAPDISIVYEFAIHLASFGAKLWEVDGNTLTPTINSDATLAALENFIRFEPYSDPASYTYTWGDVFTSISRGHAATGILWHDYINWINDSIRSYVAGRMKMIENPAGPQGSFSTFGGAGIGVSRYSRNPEAAWLWLQWATAKGTQEELLLDTYHVYPTRQSVLDVPEVSGKLGSSEYSAANLARNIWNSGKAVGLIGFPKWYQVLDPLSFHLNKAWSGIETPKQALDAIQQRVVALGNLTF